MASRKTDLTSRACDLEKIEEICLSKEALHDKLSALAHHTDRCARRNDEAVVWKARYASLILLFRDRERWWQRTPNWPECREALKGVWGESQFAAVSPTLESVFWLAELAGRASPVRDPANPSGALEMEATIQHCFMWRHGAALRELLRLPDDRGSQEPRPILIVLSSKGAWQPTEATVIEWGAALPEPEALAATHLAVALAAAYPNRKISVLPAETRNPQLEKADYHHVQIGEFDECYREPHTLVLGAEAANCFANVIRRRMKEVMPKEQLLPWPDQEEYDKDAKGEPLYRYGVRLPPRKDEPDDAKGGMSTPRIPMFPSVGRTVVANTSGTRAFLTRESQRVCSRVRSLPVPRAQLSPSPVRAMLVNGCASRREQRSSPARVGVWPTPPQGHSTLGLWICVCSGAI